jgi:hypothetical protein
MSDENEIEARAAQDEINRRRSKALSLMPERPKDEEQWHEFEVVQGGLVVTSAGCIDRERAYNEALRYAMTYAHDGPCEVREAAPIEPGDWEDD